MADPTLISNVTPYSGFTVEQICERLLASRGMTLDATTMRSEAIATDIVDAYNRIRRSCVLLQARFPGIFTIQPYTVTWIQDDSMLALPANARDVVYVDYDGRPLKPLSRKMRQNILDGRNSSTNVQEYKATGETSYYFLAGMANVGTADDPDYRPVIELIPAPSNARTLEIGYNAKAPALPSSTAEEKDNPLPYNEALQEWILRRAQELWGADESDKTSVDIAREERSVLEMDIDEMLEANMEYPSVVLPEYPTEPNNQRR